MNGFIKVDRKILEWEWYADLPTKVLFLHCLLAANYKDKKWQGEIIKRGSFITSINGLAEATGLTVQQVRTSLKKLKSTGELTCRATNRFTLIIVENYEKYQGHKPKSNTQSNTQPNKQTTNKQQTNNNNIRNKEIKNIKNIKNDKNSIPGKTGITPMMQRVYEYREGIEQIRQGGTI